MFPVVADALSIVSEKKPQDKHKHPHARSILIRCPGVVVHCTIDNRQVTLHDPMMIAKNDGCTWLYGRVLGEHNKRWVKYDSTTQTFEKAQ